MGLQPQTAHPFLQRNIPAGLHLCLSTVDFTFESLPITAEHSRSGGHSGHADLRSQNAVTLQDTAMVTLTAPPKMNYLATRRKKVCIFHFQLEHKLVFLLTEVFVSPKEQHSHQPSKLIIHNTWAVQSQQQFC